MKKKINKEQNDRKIYLQCDFGAVLAQLTPLDLNIEFPAPTQSISIRLPRGLLNRIRVLADEKDIPYQSLIKSWLVDRVKKIDRSFNQTH
jgi:predicted DNA binding CopG/RHH family protein